jgi:DNA-binding transcriptional ArsR family regulator
MTDSLIFAKAVADETRQEIMRLLCCEWLCVNDVASHLDVTQPTVSHHLAVLREAGLVNTRRDGKQVYYTLNQQEVAVCCGMLMRRFAPEEVDFAHPIELTEKAEEPTNPPRPARRPDKGWQVWD